MATNDSEGNGNGAKSAVEFDGVSKVFDDGTEAVKDLNLRVEGGEFVALLGPSGCGKTTALRMLAGLETVSGGAIRIDGKEMQHLDPRHRQVAMVFQNYALYPHMTAGQNLAFPLQRLVGMDKAKIGTRVAEVAGLLEIGDLLDRRPGQLSGGQKQRVAMGRALVREPRVFLMDEPLSNLDASLRIQMRAELQRLHRDLGITTLYVTHDQTEAMTLGQRVAVMRNGRLEQYDAPERVYDQPANAFVASFMGSPPMNLMPGLIRSGALHFAGEQIALADGDGGSADGRVLIGIRPEHLWPRQGEHGPTISGVVSFTESLGAETVIHVNPVHGLEQVVGMETPQRSIAMRSNREWSAPSAGERIDISCDPRFLHVFDAVTGSRLEVRPAGLLAK